MDLGFPTRIAREGLVELLVPDVPRPHGPGTRSALPFYNPAMAVARDLTVLVAARVVPRGGRVLDGLAATGALGIRIAKEAGLDIVLNDKNPRAVALVRANLERNGIPRAEVVGSDLNAYLAENHHDLVEIDPFGSPVPFLDAAIQSAHRGTALGVTATDTAVLCGTKPEAAHRRYLADVHHTDAYAEVGTRVLLGYAVRIAARFDKALEPVVSYAAEHFIKVHARVSEGAARADRALAQLGWVRFDATTGGHEPVEGPDAMKAIGPLWRGPLADSSVLDALATSPATGYPAARILEHLRAEVDLPPFYFENNAMARRARVSPPPPDRVLGALRDQGHRAVRTHFRENAFRTDAPAAEVLDAYRRLEA